MVDLFIIVIFIFGVYLGWQSGFFKQLNDLIILFISSFLAGWISDFLFGVLYKFFPFFNFSGKSEGLKSINIILWKLILYVFVIFFIIALVRNIYIKYKIEDKINDSIYDSNLTSKILGTLISFPLMIILSFNITLVLLSPNFNLVGVNNSKLASIIITKTPILSEENSNLYKNQNYIIKRINKEDNNIDNYKNVNSDIIKYMIKTNLISKGKIDKLKKDDKLLGKRIIRKINDDEAVDEDIYENESEENTVTDQEKINIDNKEEHEEEQEEYDYIDEEDVVDDDFIQEDIIEGYDETNDFCSYFPEEC